MQVCWLPTGIARPFDAGADGYVRGEGCAVVVLKRLSDAQRDGDRIQAVIRGGAINQDGRSNGLTAPNGLSQQAVLRTALQHAGLEPSAIGYIETHGTGTPLGDPIEINALKTVYNTGRDIENTLWLGALKTNIGHLEAAAGIAGLIKTVLVLQHKEILPNLNFTQLNPNIQLDGTAMRLLLATGRWHNPIGVPRGCSRQRFRFRWHQLPSYPGTSS